MAPTSTKSNKALSHSGPSRFSYSGSDFSMWAYFPLMGDTTIINGNYVPLAPVQSTGFLQVDIVQGTTSREGNSENLVDGHLPIEFNNVQTLSHSFTASLSAVETVGSTMPAGFTSGQKTYAGTMIFTLLDRDPLVNLIKFIIDRGNNVGDMASPHYSVDQIPPFNLVLTGVSEHYVGGNTPMTMSKVLTGIKFMTNGEVVSVDDFFIEQTYQFVCTYVSPWMPADDKGVTNLAKYNKPSTAVSITRHAEPGVLDLLSSKIKEVIV